MVMLAFMTVGLVLAGTVSHSFQFSALNERTNRDLQQEVSELRQLADTGEQRRVDDLLAAFLAANVPSQYEAMMAMVGDQVTLVSAEAPVELNRLEVVDFVRARRVDGRTVIHDLHLDGATYRVAIVSVRLPSDPTPGTLVVGIDLSTQRRAILDSLAVYGLVSLVTIALTGLAGSVVAGRLLRPLQRLRQASREISTDDLTRRVPVSSADTDVSALAHTFNTMLDRLEEGFAGQRQFLDDAAHELRTPLTILRGNIELMRSDDPDDVEQTRDLVLDELDRLHRLVDDLLLLARSQRPDFVVLAPIDLAVFTDETMDRIRLLGERRWVVDARAEGTVLGDRHRLVQAMVQLAANAVKFSQPGDTVALSVRSGPDEVHLGIRDTGIGIDDANRHRIFERFARADSRAEGFGLGLSIVAAIAAAHHGDVEVVSAPGRGSTFTIRFPRLPADPTHDQTGDRPWPAS